MKFKMIHENYNVSDLDRSIKFYNEALDLHEVRRKTTDDFIIVYLSNDVSDFELELTWLKDHPQPYNLGECEFHLAFKAEDYEAAYKKHKEMGCICFENEAMGIYFIVDPRIRNTECTKGEEISSQTQMATGLRFCRKAGWEIEEIMLIRFSEDFKGVCYHENYR